MDQWMNYFSFNGSSYPFGMGSGNYSLNQKADEVDHSFAGYAHGLYRSNGIVFACIGARHRLFTEARFQFRALKNGRPGDLFGTQALTPLEKPWLNGTTGDLLGRAIQDADICGNAFILRPGRIAQPSTGVIKFPGDERLARLRPDWVTVVAGGDDKDPAAAEVLGYTYTHGGIKSGNDPIFYGPEQVAHWTPTPDPMCNWLGMSWLTPVITEIMADSAMMTHKLKFFEHGATSNLMVTMDPAIKKEQFDMWVSKFKQGNEGLWNAYKTLFLGGGADAKVIGTDMKQMDFKVVQGSGETRVASAAGVPPIIVGLSEGLQAVSYNSYGQARRAFADMTMRPLWRGFCSSMGSVIDAPQDKGASELWYDDRDISFLQEDRTDAINIQQTKATTIHTLVTAGFTPDSVIAAVESDDYSTLEHTGMFSVQLLPAGTVSEGKGSVVTGTDEPAKGSAKSDPNVDDPNSKSSSPSKPAGSGTNDTGRVLAALLASKEAHDET
jgi:phage portal protein BeeE